MKKDSTKKQFYPELVSIANRMHQIRQLRGYKQAVVAELMGITQQAYSIMENSDASMGILTLMRFCKAVEVPVWFLVATKVAVTQENMDLFCSKDMAAILKEYSMLQYSVSQYAGMMRA